MSAARLLRESVAIGLRGVGGNVVTVGRGGVLPNLAALEAYVKAATKYTAISTPSTTVSITNGSKFLTTTGGALFTNKAVMPGDIWSPDGTEWYNIAEVRFDGQYVLATKYLGSTLSGATAYFARPYVIRAALLPGDFTDDLILDQRGPFFLDLWGMPGSRITSSAEAVTVEQIGLPRQGRIRLFDCTLDALNGGANFENASATGHATCRVELHNVTARTTGVDCYTPNTGAVGEVVTYGGYFQSAQDVFMPVCESLRMYGSHVKGTPVAFLPSMDTTSLILRLFRLGSGQEIRLQDCELEIDHGSADPASGKSVFFHMSAAGNFFADRCSMIAKGDAAGKVVLFSNYGSGTAFDGKCKIAGGRIEKTFNSGTFEIVDSSVTYTGTGTVTLNLLDKGGAVSGGAGTLVPVENSCVA